MADFGDLFPDVDCQTFLRQSVFVDGYLNEHLLGGLVNRGGDDPQAEQKGEARVQERRAQQTFLQKRGVHAPLLVHEIAQQIQQRCERKRKDRNGPSQSLERVQKREQGRVVAPRNDFARHAVVEVRLFGIGRVAIRGEDEVVAFHPHRRVGLVGAPVDWLVQVLRGLKLAVEDSTAVDVLPTIAAGTVGGEVHKLAARRQPHRPIVVVGIQFIHAARIGSRFEFGDENVVVAGCGFFAEELVHLAALVLGTVGGKVETIAVRRRRGAGFIGLGIQFRAEIDRVTPGVVLSARDPQVVASEAAGAVGAEIERLSVAAQRRA